MADDIQLSKEGIKLSYKRFLSDSTPGYVLILLALLAYKAGLPLPFAAPFVPPLGSEAKVFLFLLLFLLATPVGLLFNAVSWFLFGGLQVRIVMRWLLRPDGRLLWATHRTFATEMLRAELQLGEPDLSGVAGDKLAAARGRKRRERYERVALLQEAITVHQPAAAAVFEHTEGLRRMCRALSLVMLVAALYLVGVQIAAGWTGVLLGWMAASFAAAAAFFLFACALDVYGALQILLRAYVLRPDAFGGSGSHATTIKAFIESKPGKSTA